MVSRTDKRKRWIFQLLSILLLSGVSVVLHQVFFLAGSPTAYYTGALLLLICVFLALFNLRKKIPQLNLIKAATWTQWHIYLGIIASLLFFLHAGIPFDGGLLDKFLATFFLLVCVSGFLGLWLTRSLPPRMTMHGENLTYERCGIYRRQILESAEEFIIKSERDQASSTLSEFYQSVIQPYLNRKAPLFYPFGNRAKVSEIQSSLKNLDRFLSLDERSTAGELAAWVSAKENLDFQESSQRLLKGWLFFHIPGTMVLMILIVVHIWIALQYGSFKF